MKARNVRLCKKVVAIAMATSFTVVGTAAKVSGDEVKFSPELVKGHYYDEDVKKNRQEINTYLDFQNSKCSLIILISDSSDIEMYFKDNELKEQIINTCQLPKDVVWGASLISITGKNEIGIENIERKVKYLRKYLILFVLV